MDVPALARQLRCPTGEMGEQVGKKMAEFNAEANGWTLELLEIKPRDRVLEIGFGPGETLALAAKEATKGTVAGIDFSETMLAVAQKRNQEAIESGHMELVKAEASSIPFPETSFDRVYAANVLYFWSNPVMELREIYRILKPKGRAVLYATDSESWWPGIRDTGIFHAHTPEQMKVFVHDTGFSSVKVLQQKIKAGNAHAYVMTK